MTQPLELADPGRASARPEVARDEPGLARRVQGASIAVVLGQGAGHAIRLGSNLVLTRLLFPEAFGIMAIAQAFSAALEMFSDIGVAASVVQNERGEEREFLDTAWTLQVLRGLLLWVVALLLCRPIAAAYGEPRLEALLAVSSLGVFVTGLGSMSLALLRRRMQIGRLTAIEVSTRVAGAAVTVALAFALRSVWALVFGGLAAATIRTVVSHAIVEAPRHRLRAQRSSAGAILRFGSWIFAATPFAFVLNRGDRLLLGGLVTLDELGRFAIGALLVGAVVDVGQEISGRVLFPLYARVGRVTDATLLRRVGRIRIALMAAFLPPLWLLTLWGDRLVALLYDDRYEGAGWIAQILAAGMILPTIGRIGPVFMARGETWVNFVSAAVPAVVLVVGVFVGHALGGVVGVVVAIAAARSSQYPLQVAFSRRFGLWMPLHEAAGIASSALVVGLGTWIIRA